MLQALREVTDGQWSSQSYQLAGMGKLLPLTCQQQSRLNYKRRLNSTHMRVHLEYPGWVIAEAVPLDPTGHLLL